MNVRRRAPVTQHMADIDIDVDYESITQVAALLRQAQRTLSPQLAALHAQVDALLAPGTGGGTWISQTSPAIRCQYEQFHAAAAQYLQAVAGFSRVFALLVANLQSVEGTMAYSASYPAAD